MNGGKYSLSCCSLVVEEEEEEEAVEAAVVEEEEEEEEEELLELFEAAATHILFVISPTKYNRSMAFSSMTPCVFKMKKLDKRSARQNIWASWFSSWSNDARPSLSNNINFDPRMVICGSQIQMPRVQASVVLPTEKCVVVVGVVDKEFTIRLSRKDLPVRYNPAHATISKEVRWPSEPVEVEVRQSIPSWHNMRLLVVGSS